MGKPVIAMTMGDPAGIGPELVVKVLSDATVWERCAPFVIGNMAVLADAARTIESDLRFNAIANLTEARFAPLEIDVLRQHIGETRAGELQRQVENIEVPGSTTP